MTNRKETPSKTGKAIRDRINAIIGINRHSNYDVARIIDKSERYVRVHRKGDLEWSLGDVERYGAATGYTPGENHGGRVHDKAGHERAVARSIAKELI
mgnify:CR=1 FL=1